MARRRGIRPQGALQKLVDNVQKTTAHQPSNLADSIKKTIQLVQQLPPDLHEKVTPLVDELKPDLAIAWIDNVRHN